MSKLRISLFSVLLTLTFLLPPVEISCAANIDDLIHAVWGFELKKAAELIDGGVDVNEKNAQGTFPLLLACSYKDNDEMIELLLSRGAKPTIRGPQGNTPLNMAAKYSKKAVEMLLAKGAEIDAPGQGDTTALMWAGMSGQVEIVKLLISRGADVNARDKDGWTPVRWAQEQKQDEVVKILRANRAKD